jgi:TonB family protein
MRILGSVLSLFLAMPALASDTKAPAPLELSVHGQIEIGPDGSVLSHQLDKRLNPAVRALVARNVERWRFEPITENGRPVIASTRMVLELSALPLGDDDLQLRVDDVRFGIPAERGPRTAPIYPRDAIKQRLGARVLLALQLDEAGKVIAAHPYQTSLSSELSGSRAQRMRQLFETATLKAAQDWQFTPAERVAGAAVGASVKVPVDFRIGIGGWQSYVPGPLSPAPWMESSAQATGNDAELQDGELVALDSRFRLQGSPIGEIL